MIIYPITQLLELCFNIPYNLTKSEGLSILTISVAVTILCLPLYIVAERWQEHQRLTEQKMKAQVSRIKSVFKGDEQYMILTTYYKQNHYHPMMALRSSFGLLIQIPFFLAAYHFLSELELLKGHQFLFMKDLGQPDALFTIGTFKVNILPIAMTLINCISGLIYSRGHGAREKIQIFSMAALFLVVLYPSPSGLVFYWTMNNMFSMIKNIFYKLKNPLKSFYFFASAICLALIVITILNVADFKKYLMIAGFLAVIASPLIIKGASKIIDTFLVPLVEDQKLCMILFFTTALAMCFLSGYTIPSSVIASSPQEFSGIGNALSPFTYIRESFVQAFGFCVFWPSCIYFLFGKRTKSMMAFLGLWLLIASLVNAYAFVGNYGTINNLLVFSDFSKLIEKTSTIFINLICVAAVFAAVLFVTKYFAKKLAVSISAIILIVVAAFSVINSKKISDGFAYYLELQSKNTHATEITPVFHFSKTGKNVLFLMLDRSEGEIIPEMFEKLPEVRENWTGFTYYPNVLSYNGHTFIGSSPCFGGYEYTPEAMNERPKVSLKDKHNESLLAVPRIFTEKAGYHATLADSSWANHSWIADMSICDDYKDIDGITTKSVYTPYWYREHNFSTNSDMHTNQLKRNFLWLSLFRCSPNVFRILIYKKGTWRSLDQATTEIMSIVDDYAVLEYLPKLTDTNADKPNFISFVNEISHSTFPLDYPTYSPSLTPRTDYPEDKKNLMFYMTNIAQFVRIGEWFKFLKENGVYDNTRIIVTSDHGFAGIQKCFEEDVELDLKVADRTYFGRGHYHPTLMIKDFNAEGSLVTDNSFMTNADAPAMALHGLVEKPVNPYTGKEYSLEANEKAKENGVYITTSDGFGPEYHTENLLVLPEKTWWHVKDNIFESKNWVQESPEK